MDKIAPDGPVYQAGTLSGNPLAVAAGLVTLTRLQRDDPYPALEARSAALADGLTAAAREAGVTSAINRVGSMMTCFFGVERVNNFDDASKADTAAYGRYFRAMLDRGVYLAPSQYEAAFVSVAHGEVEIEQTVAAAREALAQLD